MVLLLLSAAIPQQRINERFVACLKNVHSDLHRLYDDYIADKVKDSLTLNNKDLSRVDALLIYVLLFSPDKKDQLKGRALITEKTSGDLATPYKSTLVGKLIIITTQEKPPHYMDILMELLDCVEKDINKYPLPMANILRCLINKKATKKQLLRAKRFLEYALRVPEFIGGWGFCKELQASLASDKSEVDSLLTEFFTYKFVNMAIASGRASNPDFSLENALQENGDYLANFVNDTFSVGKGNFLVAQNERILELDQTTTVLKFYLSKDERMIDFCNPRGGERCSRAFATCILPCVVSALERPLELAEDADLLSMVILRGLPIVFGFRTTKGFDVMRRAWDGLEIMHKEKKIKEVVYVNLKLKFIYNLFLLSSDETNLHYFCAEALNFETHRYLDLLKNDPLLIKKFSELYSDDYYKAMSNYWGCISDQKSLYLLASREGYANCRLMFLGNIFRITEWLGQMEKRADRIKEYLTYLGTDPVFDGKKEIFNFIKRLPIKKIK